MTIDLRSLGLSWFLDRSGIPSLFFLIAMVLASSQWTELLAGLFLGVLGLTVIQSFLGREAYRRPHRLFCSSVAALVLATMVSWLTPGFISAGFLVVTSSDRLERMRSLQKVLEGVWSLEAVCFFLALWLVLVLALRYLRVRVQWPLPPEKTRLRSWLGSVSIISLLVLLNSAVFCHPSLAKPASPQGLNAYELPFTYTPVSFLPAHTSIQDPRWPYRVVPDETTFAKWSDLELLSIYTSAAREIDNPQYSLHWADFAFLQGLAKVTSRFAPGQEQVGDWAVSNLTLDRRRRHEFHSYRTLQAFRYHTLSYLSQASLTQEEIDAWRARAQGLVLSPDTVLFSCRFPETKRFDQELPLRVLGVELPSLPSLYYDLEQRWIDIFEGRWARERQLRQLQPELAALSAILDMKEQKALTGSYPPSLEIPESLGHYEPTEGQARLTLWELDWTRPKVVLRLP